MAASGTAGRPASMPRTTNLAAHSPPGTFGYVRSKWLAAFAAREAARGQPGRETSCRRSQQRSH